LFIFIFINIGICNVTELKLYSFPGKTFTLKFSMDLPKYNNVIFKQNNVNVTIDKCNDKELSVLKYNIPYCELPKCDLKIFDEENVECLKGQSNVERNTNYNKYNIIKCINGYSGDYCNNTIIYDTRYFFFFFFFFFFF